MRWNFLCKTDEPELKLCLFESVKLINKEDWDEVVKHSANIYLTVDYLAALEESMNGMMGFRYIQLYNDSLKPVAVGYFQLLNFRDKGYNYHDILCKVGDRIKNKLLEKIDINVMVCGNAFACGENGFAHTAEITREDALKSLYSAMSKLNNLDNPEDKISGFLFKEMWPDSIQDSKILKEFNFRSFSIDVNMVMKIHPGWKSMDDYLESMITKFRTKAKGVYKKSSEIIVLDFSADDITKHKTDIQKLYNSVLSKADFSFGELNADVFYYFKKQLKSKFVFKGYYLNDLLIGFSTAFVFNNVVDANYVGINYEHNQQYALYQRMLYDYVELAISKKAKELRLGRTAEEIKSCIGAVPVNMKLYLRHRNSISNKLIKPVIESISPSIFELRNPFKAQFSYN